MNPNIANVLSVIPFSPVEYIWFDFSGMDKVHDNLMERFGEKRLADFAQNELVERFPLPFERIAIVIPTTNKKNVPITLERVGNNMSFKFWADGLDEAATTVTLDGTIKDMYVFFHPKFEKLIHQTKINDYYEQHQILLNVIMWGLVAISLNMAPPENSRAHKCVANPKNPSRVKRGKKPLFEWETVTIKPHEPRVSHGGTHASPKPHDRRGHQRRYKSGKVVYVRPHTINKHKIPTEGFIFHDYKVAL